MNDIFIKTYLDEDVDVLIAKLVRLQKFKSLTFVEAGKRGKSDAEQLKYATQNGYAILTHNRKDYEDLARNYFEDDKTHCGIIIAVRRPVHEITERLLKILITSRRTRQKTKSSTFRMNFTPDKFHEECGVFGIYGHGEASTLTQLGLFALQHRGQEACGIVSSDDKYLHQFRSMGLVADVLSEDVLKSLRGKSAIGHTRYSTAGRNTIKEVQPFSVICQHGQIAVCHNGNLPYAKQKRRELEKQGAIFSSTSDTETILHSIARCEAPDAIEAIQRVLSETEGAFSLLFLTPKNLIAVRDPRGFRPLNLGKLNGAWCVASETCAFDLIDAEYVREIKAGEMLVINESGLHSSFPFEEKPKSVCAFEHVYFSRPDSIIFGRSVNQSRHNMGKRLAVEHPIANADENSLVVPVPDSGVAASIGYARESGINFRQAIIRNHYIGRTFIEPSQSIRSFGVRLKLNPIRDLINGRRVVLVDDSIVRGTTSKKIVQMVREAGAKEVHMRISCPPTVSPCYYGVDTPRKAELIAAQMSVEEVCRYIEADSLGYLSLEGMLEAIGLENGSSCVACWNGNYPTPVADGKPTIDNS